MPAPVTYHEHYLREHNRETYFELLWGSLPWEQREGAPRREAWFNPYGEAYTYGSGEYARTYEAHKLVAWEDPAISLVWGIMQHLNSECESSYDCCFVNGYENGRQHLGWHADDSPEMDNDHPIATVSLGAAREIWFRKRSGDGGYYDQSKLMLANGSAAIMHAGMQQAWQHRIPKSSVADCGPRISLTFRKLVR